MRRRTLLWALVSGLVVFPSCRNAAEDSRPAPPRTGSERAAAGFSRPASDRPRIVALGDSLTAGLGLDQADAWPAVLQRRLDEAGYAYDVINAGVSGDTTAGGMRRLDWALDGPVEILIIELGANDGLRGLSVQEMRRNLDTMITRATAQGIRVLLCGMEAPPNFGQQYAREFRQAFRSLADEHRVAFLPFFLDGVAGDPALNQPDGIHPNVEGTRLVADLVWQALEPMLERSPTTS
jgi:acyl-CoA thioesterase-1